MGDSRHGLRLQGLHQVTFSSHSGRHSCSVLRVLGVRSPSPQLYDELGGCCLHHQVLALGCQDAFFLLHIIDSLSLTPLWDLGRTLQLLPATGNSLPQKARLSRREGHLDLQAPVCGRLLSLWLPRLPDPVVKKCPKDAPVPTRQPHPGDSWEHPGD